MVEQRCWAIAVALVFQRFPVVVVTDEFLTNWKYHVPSGINTRWCAVLMIRSSDEADVVATGESWQVLAIYEYVIFSDISLQFIRTLLITRPHYFVTEHQQRAGQKVVKFTQQLRAAGKLHL